MPAALTCRIEVVRRETADAEARAAQLEAELARMVAAQKDSEADLDAKQAALDR